MMAVLGVEAALFTCNINTPAFTRVTTHTQVGQHRNGKQEVRALAGAAFIINMPTDV